MSTDSYHKKHRPFWIQVSRPDGKVLDIYGFRTIQEGRRQAELFSWVNPYATIALMGPNAPPGCGEVLSTIKGSRWDS